MPTVGAFRVSGLYLWFNSADHLPPHFHAEKVGRWEVRVFFLRDRSEMVELRWGHQPRPSELAALLRLVERHRLALHEEWGAKVSVRTPGARR